MRRTVFDLSLRVPHWLLATLILLILSVLINYIDRGNLATAGIGGSVSRTNLLTPGGG